jgi:hypothetical protein
LEIRCERASVSPSDLVTHRIESLNGEPAIVTYAGIHDVGVHRRRADLRLLPVLDPEKLRRLGAN